MNCSGHNEEIEFVTWVDMVGKTHVVKHLNEFYTKLAEQHDFELWEKEMTV